MLAGSRETPERLYLFQLSTATIPIPGGSLAMSNGCYLVQTATGQNLLIDSGLTRESPPAGMPLAENEKNVLQHLETLGLRTEDIDTVICTHFDVDHVGYHDSLKQAEFIVQREHYELAHSGHPRFAAARPHWDHPDLQYRMVDRDIELLPGLTLLKTSAHAPAHQSILLRLPYTGPVLLAIDAVVMERLFTPDRVAWSNDDDQEQLRASTQKLLDVVESERVGLVIFGHDGQQWQTLKKAPAYYD